MQLHSAGSAIVHIAATAIDRSLHTPTSAHVCLGAKERERHRGPRFGMSNDPAPAPPSAGPLAAYAEALSAASG